MNICANMVTAQQPETIMARPFKGITFWDRVYSHTVQQGECLVFTGHRDECGYGRMQISSSTLETHWASTDFVMEGGQVI